MRQTKLRQGFTLVELLTVIFIIGVLVSLLLVAIIGVGGKGVDAKCVNDIRQMATALDNFKGKYGSYPPSRITLSGNEGSMDARSIAFIRSIWPRIDYQNSFINWAGVQGGGAAARSLVFTLEGDQCLVFFLSGIPNQDAPGAWGFSSNPSNPTDISTGTKESFYQFETGRLFARPTSKMYQAYGEKIKFYSYQDPYSTGQPYVYFGAGRNGYNDDVPPGDNPILMPTVKGLSGPYCEGAMDAAGKLAALQPLKYINPTRFQIISAGKDGLFGPGGPWAPAIANTYSKWYPAGADDVSNFYDAKLGVPQ